MPSELVDMMYTIVPIPIEDKEFLRLLELARKKVHKTTRMSKSGDEAPKNEYKH
jgi:hypothetical protein